MATDTTKKGDFVDFLIKKAVENWAKEKGIEKYETVETEDGKVKVVGKDADGNDVELDITRPTEETRAARAANRAVAWGLLPPQCAPYVKVSPHVKGGN